MASKTVGSLYCLGTVPLDVVSLREKKKVRMLFVVALLLFLKLTVLCWTF